MTFAKIKDILCAIENPVEKLEMVMDLGRILEPVPDNAVCTEIHGCASRVEFCVLGNGYFAVADSALKLNRWILLGNLHHWILTWGRDD